MISAEEEVVSDDEQVVCQTSMTQEFERQPSRAQPSSVAQLAHNLFPIGSTIFQGTLFHCPPPIMTLELYRKGQEALG